MQIEKTKEFVQFKKFATQMGAEIKMTSCNPDNSGHYAKSNIKDKAICEKVGSLYKSINLEQIATYKDPSRHINKNIENHDSKASYHSLQTIEYNAKTEHIDMDFKTHNLLNKVQFAKKIKDIKAITKMRDKARNELFEAELKYAQIRYAGSRYKSKIIRTSLGNSSEGREVLKLLQTSTGLKMLPKSK